MKLWKVSVLLAAAAMFAVPANAQDTCGTAVPPGAVDPCADSAPDDEGVAGTSCAGGTLDSWVVCVAGSADERIRTDIGSGGTDSEVTIYGGSCGALVEVACNNDECFTGVNYCPDQICDGDAAGPWMSNACTGGLTPGATYYARVTTFGDYCVIASQSGVAGHLKIGQQVTIGSKSGVMRDIADKETVLGFPAVPHTRAKRQWVGIQRLPDIQIQLRELEKQVAALKARLD